MAGLQLNARLGTGANYTPLVPASASSPTSSSGGIGQAAFGITGGADTQRTTAGYGAVGIGIAAVIGLVYLWWSLPR